jgi:hypothetical protein
VSLNIDDLEGKRLMYYTWGLRNVSNNIIEAYSLWMGLSLANEIGIQTLLVLGNSMLISKCHVKLKWSGKKCIELSTLED